MLKLKLSLLILLSLLVAGGRAFSVPSLLTDNVPIMVKLGAQHGGDDKSSSIIASINGHYLSVTFTENLGEVTTRIYDESGTPVDCSYIGTPSCDMFYIPLAGRYIVVFTLSNCSEYTGEFDVTD